MKSYFLEEFVTDMRNTGTMEINVSDVLEAPPVATQFVDVVRVRHQPGAALWDFHVVQMRGSGVGAVENVRFVLLLIEAVTSV